MIGSETEIAVSEGSKVSAAVRVELRNEEGGMLKFDKGTVAKRWTSAKKNRAIETLFVECVEGNPYSR